MSDTPRSEWISNVGLWRLLRRIPGDGDLIITVWSILFLAVFTTLFVHGKWAF